MNGQNEILAVVGKKGSGKSHWVKQWIRARREPVVIFDRMDEYHAAGACASDPIPGALRFADDNGAGLRPFLDHVEKTGRLPRVSVVLADPREADALCRFAMRAGGLSVVFEEADAYMSPSQLSQPFQDLIRRGRHKGVSQVYVTRRPAELHRDVTANADLDVYFMLQEGLDLDWVRRRGGDILLDSVRKLDARQHVQRRA